MVKALLARGALLDSRQAEFGGVTALHWALLKGHDRCVELLLLAGSDPTLEGTMGNLGMISPLGMVRHDGDGAEVFARVAALLCDTAARGSASDPSAILRCGAKLRRRAQLTELLGAGLTQAHATHARHAMVTATELLQSNLPADARVAYTDALLWGALGPRSAFECLHNLAACLQMVRPHCSTHAHSHLPTDPPTRARPPTLALAHSQCSGRGEAALRGEAGGGGAVRALPAARRLVAPDG